MSIAESRAAAARPGRAENLHRMGQARSGCLKALGLLEGIVAGETWHGGPAYDRILTLEALNNTLDQLVTDHWSEAAEDGPANTLLRDALADLIELQVDSDGHAVPVNDFVQLPVDGVFQLSLQVAVSHCCEGFDGTVICQLRRFAEGVATYAVEVEA